MNRAWNSSMEIGVRVEAENSYTGTSKHILSAFFTFVALDEHNKVTPVPALITENRVQERRYQQADIRRAARLKTIEDLKHYDHK